jgi:predicted DNA-binding transcriptional regulator YafY
MSFRAKMQRVAFIDRRLRYKRDYPSAGTFEHDYLDEAGETFDKRTWKRDIEWLREQGAPIEYDAHRHGYFYSDESFSLPALSLSEGDLLAILVADRALSSYRNSPFYERMQQVFNRLAAFLPDRVSVHSSELAGNVSVIAEPVTEIKPQVWETLQRCLNEERSVRIQYQAPGYSTPAVRKLDPYHIVGHKGEWYLLGWSHHDQSIRIYALGRIQSCRRETARFSRPAEFRADDYIDPSFGVFVKEEQVDVAIRFDPPVASKIQERCWHPKQRIEKLEGGSIVLHYTTNQQTQTLFWVSSWGPNAEVLSPPELRTRAAEWFRASAARYEGV